MTAGVRVFQYEKGYLDAKTISIDSEICSIGAANIDIRSFSINYELNAVFYSNCRLHGGSDAPSLTQAARHDGRIGQIGIAVVKRNFIDRQAQMLGGVLNLH